MTGYESLSESNLQKILKRKVDQLHTARINRDTMREKNILREMHIIETILRNREKKR